MHFFDFPMIYCLYMPLPAGLLTMIGFCVTILENEENYANTT